MRQARRPEGIGHVGRLGAIVAERDAGQQAALPVGQALRAAGEGAAQAVGQAGRRAARTPARHGVDAQPPGDVAMAQPTLAAAGGLDPADDADTLTGQSIVERAGSRGSGHPAQSASVESQVGRHTAAPIGHRVAHQRDLGLHRARRQGCVEAGQ